MTGPGGGGGTGPGGGSGTGPGRDSADNTIFAAVDALRVDLQTPEPPPPPPTPR